MSRGAAQRMLADAFAAEAIEPAQVDARVILCAALGIDHAGLICDPQRPLGPCAGIVQSFAARRLRREPVARIIGYREFWRSRFKIGPAVLDPRPATETLIGAVLALTSRSPRKSCRIADLGTGSGAILCSLLLSLPGSTGIGVDISQGACAIARENLAALGLAGRGLIVCGNWTQALRGPFDVVVSNPPYVARGEIADLSPEVREHDPHLALDGGADGLRAYRDLIPASLDVLSPGGLIALEVGKDQRFAVEVLLRQTFATPVEAFLDLDGHWRVLAARSAKQAEA
jgi:release factor glutamine methyltransferase